MALRLKKCATNRKASLAFSRQAPALLKECQGAKPSPVEHALFQSRGARGFLATPFPGLVSAGLLLCPFPGLWSHMGLLAQVRGWLPMALRSSPVRLLPAFLCRCLLPLPLSSHMLVAVHRHWRVTQEAGVRLFCSPLTLSLQEMRWVASQCCW